MRVIFRIMGTIALLRTLIRETLLNEGIYDPGILKAVFMAGGPGSGKSHTAALLFGADPKSLSRAFTVTGLKIINSDPAFEKFLRDVGVSPRDLAKISKEDPELAYELGLDDERGVPPSSPRGKAKRMKQSSLKQFTRQDAKLGVILDGTGDDFDKISTKKSALEDLGYDTYMVFVNTTLEVAQERNAKRERQLDPAMLEQIWTDVQANLGSFQGLFGANNLIIVDNTVYEPMPPLISKAVDAFIRRPIQNPIGRQWIEDELGQRGGGTNKERQRLLGQKRKST